MNKRMVFNDPLFNELNETLEYNMTELVYVLIESNEDGNSVIGVYRDYDTAFKEKCAIIRDYYEIPVDEVADKDLDDEIHPMSAYYEIVKRKLL